MFMLWLNFHKCPSNPPPPSSSSHTFVLKKTEDFGLDFCVFAINFLSQQRAIFLDKMRVLSLSHFSPIMHRSVAYCADYFNDSVPQHIAFAKPYGVPDGESLLPIPGTSPTPQQVANVQGIVVLNDQDKLAWKELRNAHELSVTHARDHAHARIHTEEFGVMGKYEVRTAKIDRSMLKDVLSLPQKHGTTSGGNQPFTLSDSLGSDSINSLKGRRFFTTSPLFCCPLSCDWANCVLISVSSVLSSHHSPSYPWLVFQFFLFVASPFRPWNDEFQRLLNLPDSQEKFQGLTSLGKGTAQRHLTSLHPETNNVMNISTPFFHISRDTALFILLVSFFEFIWFFFFLPQILSTLQRHMEGKVPLTSPSHPVALAFPPHFLPLAHFTHTHVSPKMEQIRHFFWCSWFFFEHRCSIGDFVELFYQSCACRTSKRQWNRSKWEE